MEQEENFKAVFFVEENAHSVALAVILWFTCNLGK